MCLSVSVPECARVCTGARRSQQRASELLELEVQMLGNACPPRCWGWLGFCARAARALSCPSLHLPPLLSHYHIRSIHGISFCTHKFILKLTDNTLRQCDLQKKSMNWNMCCLLTWAKNYLCDLQNNQFFLPSSFIKKKSSCLPYTTLL